MAAGSTFLKWGRVIRERLRKGVVAVSAKL
jgi:hypothetical protein